MVAPPGPIRYRKGPGVRGRVRGADPRLPRGASDQQEPGPASGRVAARGRQDAVGAAAHHPAPRGPGRERRHPRSGRAPALAAALQAPGSVSRERSRCNRSFGWVGSTPELAAGARGGVHPGKTGLGDKRHEKRAAAVSPPHEALCRPKCSADKSRYTVSLLRAFRGVQEAYREQPLPDLFAGAVGARSPLPPVRGPATSGRGGNDRPVSARVRADTGLELARLARANG